MPQPQSPVFLRAGSLVKFSFEPRRKRRGFFCQEPPKTRTHSVRAKSVSSQTARAPKGGPRRILRHIVRGDKRGPGRLPCRGGPGQGTWPFPGLVRDLPLLLRPDISPALFSSAPALPSGPSLRRGPLLPGGTYDLRSLRYASNSGVLLQYLIPQFSKFHSSM